MPKPPEQQLLQHADLIELSQAARDAAYNNSAAVANSSAQMQHFEARSALLAQRPGAQLDLRYGPLPRQQFDFFAGPTGADTLLFIHGGYWQMRHKNSFRFAVEGALAQGLSAALIGYSLAPEVRLQAIANEVLQAIDTVSAYAQSHGQSGRIRLCGWSAGGHLTALSMGHAAVVAGLGISGIYDLEPIRQTYLNQALQLSAAQARALSPLHRQAISGKPFITAYGTAELAALQNQSQLFAAAQQSLLLAVEGADHFSILNALAQPQGLLLQALLEAPLAAA